MGPAGLTAVFGMGTGVAPPVWSPGIRPHGGQAAGPHKFGGRHAQANRAAAWAHHLTPTAADPNVSRVIVTVVLGVARPPAWPALVAGGRVGVVKRSAVGTGPLRRSPAVHSRPIDLVVFQEPSQLMLPETSSWRGLRA